MYGEKSNIFDFLIPMKTNTDIFYTQRPILPLQFIDISVWRKEVKDMVLDGGVRWEYYWRLRGVRPSRGGWVELAGCEAAGPGLFNRSFIEVISL